MMNSPTALTPEPANGLSLDASLTTDSMGSPQEPVSISLSSSPLTVRSERLEETPFKPGFLARKALQDIVDNTNITPNRPINQTPLRSTPLLTPPSSDERPVLPPIFAAPASQVSLIEKIKAQSALYSQAIQRQPQPSSDGAVQSVTTKVTAAPEKPTTTNLAQALQSIPELTYHQLQQQQQQSLSRQLSSNVELQNDTADNRTGENVSVTESAGLTAVELPNSIESKDTDDKFRGEGSKQIATIPKPDPLENPLNTTNVYINGLPLRWTDDDLYRLTRGFGAVKSVKMFTRHLEDKPSAYGFVLYNCVEDAERFILALRQHTQFHPSFAKTMKVPGTTNAKHAISDPIIPIPRDEEYADVSITGLPLSIDMQTLRTLFAPQTIKASKFFHTTGTPRRLIGFVRLEGQQAAEDIIERLHGSTVLGWSEKLNVQPMGVGIAPASGSPDFRPSNANIIHQEPNIVMQPVITTASKQLPFISTPSLGVYQHNNVQMNDFSRLLESMKISTTSNTDHQDQSSIPFPQQSHKQQDLPTGVTVPLMPLRNHSPYTTFDQVQPQAHSLMTSLSSQYSRPPLDRNGVGLGISSVPTLQDSHRAALGVQNFAHVQDQMQPQRTQFQAMDGQSALIQALQAAVAAQDGAFSQLNLTPTMNGASFGGNVKATPEVHWPSPMDMGFSSRDGFPLQRGNYQGVPASPFGNGTVLHRTPSGTLHSTDTKVAPPSNVNSVTTNKGVPLLLPALSPSSPQLSSEESSPLTPTFQQLPNSFAASQGNEA